MREHNILNENHLKLLPSYHNMDLDHITTLNIDFFDEYKRYILELVDHFNKNEINLCDYFRDDSGYSRYFNYNK